MYRAQARTPCAIASIRMPSRVRTSTWIAHRVGACETCRFTVLRCAARARSRPTRASIANCLALAACALHGCLRQPRHGNARRARAQWFSSRTTMDADRRDPLPLQGVARERHAPDLPNRVRHTAARTAAEERPGRSTTDGPCRKPFWPLRVRRGFFWTGMPFLHEGQQADRSGEGLGAPSDNNGGWRGPSMDHQAPVCCGKDFRPDRSCEELGAEAPPTTAGRPRQRGLKPARMGSMECAPVRPCSCPISLRCAARCRGSGCRSARAPTVRCPRRRALRARAVRRARHVRGSGRKGRAAASAA